MRFLAALLCAAILASCATTSPSDSTLAAGEGVVVLRVVGNLEFPEWRSVRVRAGEGAEPITLRPVPCAVRGSTVFAASLPAGRYSADEMVAAYQSGTPNAGSLTYEVTAPIAQRTGTFRVADGQLTNLGTWVFQPGRTLSATKSEFALAVDPAPLRAEPLLAGAFPRWADAVRGKPELGWEKLAAPAEQRTRIIAAAKAAASGLSSLTLTPTGAMYAGARMGQIVFRAKLDSAWHRLDTGTFDEITSVLALADGGILAGGEQGFLAYSADRRKWRRLSVVDPNHVVSFIGAAPDRSLVLVAESSRDLVVYQSKSASSGWHELRRFPGAPEPGLVGPRTWETKVNQGATYRRDSAAFAGERLVVLQQPSTVWSFDFKTSAWSASAPAPIPVFTLRTAHDGYLWAVPITGTHMFGSSDWGATWKKLEYFALDVPPAFADRSTGYMGALPYGLTQTWKLMKTTDGGSSWTASGQMTDFAVERLAVDASGKSVIAVTPAHQLWVSGDDGKTWQGPH